MDETHVFGTTGLADDDAPAASLNFTREQAEASATEMLEPSESDVSSQQSPLENVEVTCLNSDQSPEASFEQRLVDAGETPAKPRSGVSALPPANGSEFGDDASSDGACSGEKPSSVFENNGELEAEPSRG